MFYGQHAGFGGGAAATTAFIDILTDDGLNGDCKLLLDAGDPNSYVSGQTFTDVSGGTAYNFFLGADVGAATNDPTWNSAAEASYFSFDGGDYFTQNESGADFGAGVGDAFHKNSATWTVLIWIYLPATAGQQSLFSTSSANSANTGVTLKIQSAEKLELEVEEGSGSRALSVLADAALSVNTWHLMAVSINEATGSGGGFFWADGAYIQQGSANTFDSTYSSPDTGAGSFTMQIGADGEASQIFASGYRLSMFAMFDAALSKANLDTIWTASRARFGV